MQHHGALRALLWLAALTPALCIDYFVVAGFTDSSRVWQGTLSGATGQLTRTGALDTGSKSTAWMVAPLSSDFLYVANDKNVTAVRVAWPSANVASGGPPVLSYLSTQPMPATSTHLALTREALLSVSYGANSGWGSSISANGSLWLSSPPVNLCANPHQLVVTPNTRNYDRPSQTVIVPCLGDDTIRLLTTGGGCDGPAGSVCNGPTISSRPGSGPRHAVLHPRLAVLYVLNELDSSIATWSIDVNGQTMTDAVYISSLPPGTPFAGDSSKWGAGEIALNAAGSVLYASNRPLDPSQPSTIGVWPVDAITGALGTAVGWVGAEPGSELNFPRHFSLTPDGRWLLAANQKGASLTVFSIRQSDGALSELETVDTTFDGVAPAFVAVLPSPTARPPASGALPAEGRPQALGLLLVVGAALAAWWR